jgi:hypothetical protein
MRFGVIECSSRRCKGPVGLSVSRCSESCSASVRYPKRSSCCRCCCRGGGGGTQWRSWLHYCSRVFFVHSVSRSRASGNRAAAVGIRSCGLVLFGDFWVAVAGVAATAAAAAFKADCGGHCDAASSSLDCKSAQFLSRVIAGSARVIAAPKRGADAGRLVSIIRPQV